MNKKKLVQALCIDYQKISTICVNENCNEIHQYPSDCELRNRYITTKSCCLEDFGKEICIRIDETTKRISLNYYANRTMTLSKRKFNRQRIRIQKLLNPKTDTEEEMDNESNEISNEILVRFD
jgi:hypothetical protein